MKSETKEQTFQQKKEFGLRGLWKNFTRKGGVEKLETGIKGFDEMLEGGIPKGRTLLISGSTGTGKTVLINEFLYRGITMFQENGVFVTFEERPIDIIKNVKNFGWDYEPLIKQNKLAFVDASPEKAIEVSMQYDLTPLITRIKYAIKKTNAKRVAIDSLGSLFQRFSNEDAIRGALFQISDELKNLDVTSMITAEKMGTENALTRYGVEDFVVDGVADLNIKVGQQSMIRTIIIKKLRGVGYRSGEVNFEITGDGFKVFPKIPIDRSIAKTDFAVRKKFGIDKFDDAMGGGIPQGHMVLLGGNTGAGKTTFLLHFLIEGLENGESCVFAALEEPVPQVKKTALEYGWDLEKYEKEGKLIFIDPGLIDIESDKLLYMILDAVNQNGAERVVIDSVSSIESATMEMSKVREFLIQLSGFFKTFGVTCVMNYLTTATFGAEKQQLLSGTATNEMRLSSIVDGIILLRYVERAQSVEKLLNILKMRGSSHKKDIFQFEITNRGIKMGDKFKL